MTALSDRSLTTDRETARHSPNEAARLKPTIVAGENGDWVWCERPTPAQDAAWIERQHRERDAMLSCAKTMSKLSVRYFRWAGEETSPERAAHYAAEGRKARRSAWSHLRWARERDV